MNKLSPERRYDQDHRFDVNIESIEGSTDLVDELLEIGALSPLFGGL